MGALKASETVFLLWRFLDLSISTTWLHLIHLEGALGSHVFSTLPLQLSPRDSKLRETLFQGNPDSKVPSRDKGPQLDFRNISKSVNCLPYVIHVFSLLFYPHNTVGSRGNC